MFLFSVSQVGHVLVFCFRRWSYYEISSSHGGEYDEHQVIIFLFSVSEDGHVLVFCFRRWPCSCFLFQKVAMFLLSVSEGGNVPIFCIRQMNIAFVTGSKILQ
jgi:hypothetical protein